MRKGISISNAKAVKKPVSDIRMLRKIFSLTEINYKVWKNTPSEKFPISQTFQINKKDSRATIIVALNTIGGIYHGNYTTLPTHLPPNPKRP